MADRSVLAQDEVTVLLHDGGELTVRRFVIAAEAQPIKDATFEEVEVEFKVGKLTLTGSMDAEDATKIVALLTGLVKKV
jgi:hypothetical protein